MNYVHQNIRDLFLAKGWSWQEMNNLLAIAGWKTDVRSMQRKLKGETNLRLTELMAIAKVFRIPLYQLMMSDKDKREIDAGTDARLTRIEEDLNYLKKVL